MAFGRRTAEWTLLGEVTLVGIHRREKVNKDLGNLISLLNASLLSLKNLEQGERTEFILPKRQVEKLNTLETHRSFFQENLAVLGI